MLTAAPASLESRPRFEWKAINRLGAAFFLYGGFVRSLPDTLLALSPAAGGLLTKLEDFLYWDASPEFLLRFT